MPHFTSRNPARDAARQRSAHGIVGLWALPLVLLSLWLLVGGYTVASLASATAAWRTRPATVEPVTDQVPVAMPASAAPAQAARRCKSAPSLRAAPERVL
jgi:uncharacterized iron-regulated membrane protein